MHLQISCEELTIHHRKLLNIVDVGIFLFMINTCMLFLLLLLFIVFFGIIRLKCEFSVAHYFRNMTKDAIWLKGLGKYSGIIWQFNAQWHRTLHKILEPEQKFYWNLQCQYRHRSLYNIHAIWLRPNRWKTQKRSKSIQSFIKMYSQYLSIKSYALCMWKIWNMHLNYNRMCFFFASFRHNQKL